MIDTTQLMIVVFMGSSGVIRSVVKWAELALRDHVVTKFEWKQLSQTVLRVGAINVALFFGVTKWASSAGINVDQLAVAGASAATGFLFDKILSATRKTEPVRK